MASLEGKVAPFASNRVLQIVCAVAADRHELGVDRTALDGGAHLARLLVPTATDLFAHLSRDRIADFAFRVVAAAA